MIKVGKRGKGVKRDEEKKSGRDRGNRSNHRDAPRGCTHGRSVLEVSCYPYCHCSATTTTTSATSTTTATTARYHCCHCGHCGHCYRVHTHTTHTYTSLSTPALLRRCSYPSMYSTEPTKAAELKSKLMVWLKATGAELPRLYAGIPETELPRLYAGIPETELPASGFAP